MNEPFVSIIIPVYHDWKRLETCLQALSHQTYSSEKFEVVIVNNDPDDTYPIHSSPSPKNLIFVSEGKPGSYSARNSGIRVSKGEILGFTDSDCIPARDWIGSAVKFFRSEKNIERIAGKIDLYFSSERLSCAEIYEKGMAFNQGLNARHGVAVTANMFAKRNVFETTGLFNENILSGGDIEWGARASQRGHRIRFSPEVKVSHPARKSIKEILSKSKRVCSGKLSIMLSNSNTHKILIYLYPFWIARPPLRAFAYVFRKKNLTITEKILVLLVECLKRSVMFLESYRILIKGP